MEAKEQKKQVFMLELIRQKDQEGSLIPLLQSAQDSYGYIPGKAIYYISELTGIPPAEIYGVITFYAQFRLKPLGKNLVRICEGTACHVNGARKILGTLKDELVTDVGETSEDGMFTLQSVACLGCCSLSPVMMINEETYGSLTSEKVRKTLRKYKREL